MRITLPLLIKIFLAALFLFPTPSHAVTGFLKKEEINGLSKICYYEVFGELRTVNLRSSQLCPVTHNFESVPRPQTRAQNSASGGKLGFFKSELLQGMNKICYYDVLGQRKALTISSSMICPVTYRF